MREGVLIGLAFDPAHRARHLIGFKCNHKQAGRAREMPLQHETQLRGRAAVQEPVAREFGRRV
jgi:hypothetical protein